MALKATILTCLALFAGNTIAEEKSIMEIVRANFEAADTDGNGSLDQKEFPALINANAEHKIGQAAMVKRFGAYGRAFKTADKDSDGAVAWLELIATRER